MSSRPDFGPEPVIIDGDASADIVSRVSIIKKISMLSYDISWAGTTPVGTLSVEVSNTYSQNSDGSVRNPGSWTALPLSTSTDVSGDTGTGFIDIDALGAYAIRLRYTFTSGTGLIQATIAGKVS